MLDTLIENRKAASGPYEGHQYVMEAVEPLGLTDRPLFCLDPLHAGRIIIRSKHPTVAALGDPRPWPEIDQRSYDFCVRVSPMRRVNGQRLPATDLPAWREQHFGKAQGIEVSKCFVRGGMTRCAKGGGFYVPDVVMVGCLKVTDPIKVMSLMQTGVGRHRAFGFGLLQLFERH